METELSSILWLEAEHASNHLQVCCLQGQLKLTSRMVYLMLQLNITALLKAFSMWFQMKSAYKLLPCLCHSKDSRQLLPGCIVFSQGCCYLSKTRSHGSKECETWCYNGQEPNRNLHDDALLISVFIKFGILVSSVVQIAYEHFSMGLDIYIDHSFGWQWLSTKATLFMFCRYDAVTCCPFYTLQTQFVGAHVSFFLKLLE